MHWVLEENGKQYKSISEENGKQYKSMLQSHANSTTLWERICRHKKPVVEPRQSSLFSESIEVTYTSTSYIDIISK